MKSFLLCLIAISTVGCSGGFKSASGTTAEPSLALQGVMVVDPAITLGDAQVGSMAADLSSLVSQILTDIQGLSHLNLPQNSQATINQTLNCDLGGIVKVNGNGTLGYSVSTSSLATNLSSGSATLTFTSCVLKGANGHQINVDGSLVISSLQGTANVVLGGAGPLPFTAAGSSQLNGNLTVVDGSIDQNCDLALSDQISGSGHLISGSAPGSAATVTGVFNSQMSGTFCGKAVSQMTPVTF